MTDQPFGQDPADEAAAHRPVPPAPPVSPPPPAPSGPLGSSVLGSSVHGSPVPGSPVPQGAAGRRSMPTMAEFRAMDLTIPRIAYYVAGASALVVFIATFLPWF